MRASNDSMRRIFFTSPNDHVPPLSYPLRFVYECVRVCSFRLYDSDICSLIFTFTLLDLNSKPNEYKKLSGNYKHATLIHKIERERIKTTQNILGGGARATFFLVVFVIIIVE